MKTRTIENPVGETILEVVTAQGLTVLLNPRPDFVRSYAIIGTHFGSTDVQFNDPSDGRTIDLPDGVAHFLEHKLFEDAEGDVSDRFAANGASSNARTGFTSTAYLFGCTDRLPENLDLLLGFVFDPYFTETSIAKEQGIIDQEIQMYRDDPDWRLFFNLLEGLYHTHPVRRDIAGTPESIRKITPALLESCHRTFYHPANMTLVVGGAFDPDEILARIMTDLDRHRFTPFDRPPRVAPQEPCDICQAETVERMVVSRPKLALGFKMPEIPCRGRALERLELSVQIGLDLMLGRSAPEREALVTRGLIDDSFSASFTLEPSFGFTMISADTNQPHRLRDALLEIIRKSTERGFDGDAFERIRRRYIGRLVRVFNSIDATAGALLEGSFRGVSPFESFRLLDEITVDEISTRLREHLQPRSAAISLVLPRDGKSTDRPAG